MNVVRVPRVNLTEQRFADKSAITMPKSSDSFDPCINKNT
jgi:hypothetical protein